MKKLFIISAFALCLSAGMSAGVSSPVRDVGDVLLVDNALPSVNVLVNLTAPVPFEYIVTSYASQGTASFVESVLAYENSSSVKAFVAFADHPECIDVSVEVAVRDTGELLKTAYLSTTLKENRFTILKKIYLVNSCIRQCFPGAAVAV